MTPTASRVSAAKVLLFAAALSSPLFARATGDVAGGRILYQAKCGGCHSVDENRIGPLHRGVIGRPVASVSGFNYTPALKQLGGVWTAALVDKWLQNPQAVAPGTAMYFSIPDQSEREAIIAYLASLTTTVPAALK
jgi:cytochrome c